MQYIQINNSQNSSFADRKKLFFEAFLTLDPSATADPLQG
jgi:hypothetical protein